MALFKITGPLASHWNATDRHLLGDVKVGDVVEVPFPDSADPDGDVTFNLPDGDERYIRRSSLTPVVEDEEGVVQISAVRAALVALGIEADVVAVAQAIEKAVAA